MISTRFKAVVPVSVVLVALGTLINQTVAQWTYEVCALASIGMILHGVRKHRPRNKDPWIGFAVACAFFFVSYGLRLIWPELNSKPGQNYTPADVIDTFGYLAALFSGLRLGQVRDRDRDPTTIIDAVIVTGGVSAIIWINVLLPFIQNNDLNVFTKVIAAYSSVLTIGLVFAAVRLVLGPSVKNWTSRLLGCTALFAMLSQLSVSGAFGEAGYRAFIFGSLALLSVGAAAILPSMAEMTEPVSRGVGRITKARMVIMGGALMIAPAMLIARSAQTSTDYVFYSGLIGSWVVVTVLVMVRFAGLVIARERVATAEQRRSETVASLVAALDMDSIQVTVLDAIIGLVGEADLLRVSIALSDGDKWFIQSSKGINSDIAMSHKLDGDLMNAVTAAGEVIQLEDDSTLDAPSNERSAFLLVPLLSKGEARGAIMVSTIAPLRSPKVAAISTLSTDIALAIEAMRLAEGFHRQRGEARFRALVEHSTDIIVVLVGDRIDFASPSAERLLGSDEGTTASILRLIDREHHIAVSSLLETAAGGNSRPTEFSITNENGIRWFEATATDLSAMEEVRGVVLNAREITERKQLEHDLRERVLHDDLTGLANRLLFRERVDHALKSRSDTEHVASVLFVDIDDFKDVNDALGQQAGDDILRTIAFRLEQFVRAGDTAARLSADEFAVLLEDVYTEDDASAAAERLLDVMNEPVVTEDREIDVRVSIGVALAGQSESADAILRNAEAALYSAKQGGKGRARIFDEAMQESAFERLELRSDLQRALERNELAMHYQPLISFKTGETIGFEALMRWTHSTRGFVSPGVFIPLAEESGLIVPLGQWALATALKQLKEWQGIGSPTLGMSINVSPRQLQEADVVANLSKVIADSGVDASTVTLELTESFGLDDTVSQERLKALRDLGCEIAADDFGTGFASYAALQQLPFTNVKIDRSLIMGLPGEAARAQVESIIQMGHALGLTITAEGIEEADQAHVLKEIGADKAQGYFFGRPMSGADNAEMVTRVTTIA